MNTIVIIIIILTGGWVYYLHRAPKPNKLHRINQAKAKTLLYKLQNEPFNPAYVFGILRKIDPFVFEELLLLCFKGQGYRVAKRGGYSGDGGVDGEIYDKENKYFLIQAKRYKSAINPAHVAEFAQVIKQKNAAGGFFVHTGRTGPKSYQHTSTTLKMISGKKLLELLQVKLPATKNPNPQSKAE